MSSLWCHRQKLEFGQRSTPRIAVWAPFLFKLPEKLSLSLIWGWRRTCQEMTWVQKVLLWLVVCFFCPSRWILIICLHLFVTESVCRADQAITTAPPTSPSIRTTTAPAPTPAPGIPKLGRYNVTSGGAVCLLAQMGLQLNVSYFSRSQNKVKDSFRSKDNS